MYWREIEIITRYRSKKTIYLKIVGIWISWFTLIFIIIIMTTLIITSYYGKPDSYQYEPKDVKVENELSWVAVFLHKEKKVEKLPIEEYVKSVVMSEMPLDFEIEALKAQAIVARTFIIERKLNGKKNAEHEHADVTDTTEHQVYKSKTELVDIWKKKEHEKKKKLDRAVAETEGLLVMYNKTPIQAAYFSTSNGYTENSEDYWKYNYPYLRSVESPWDRSLSPRYKTIKEIHYKELLNKLKVEQISKIANDKRAIKVLHRSESNRILKIQIGGKIFKGREVRELLGLTSTDFEWVWKNNMLVITNYGYGHGVGLSQYGANGMAKEGKKAEEILTHYFPGVSIEHMNCIGKIKLQK